MKNMSRQRRRHWRRMAQARLDSVPWTRVIPKGGARYRRLVRAYRAMNVALGLSSRPHA